MRRRGSTERDGGYNLVALMVLVAVVNIGFAAALPSITQAVKREKEAELIFRGLQYAEAIRVFQLRTGRYPVSLRELLENKPRCIRQLWVDPFNESGDWGLILAAGGTTGRRVAGGAAPGETSPEDEEDQPPRRRRRSRRTQATPEDVMPTENVLDARRRRAPRAGQVVARGPIIGVRSLSEEEGVRTFMGSTKHNEWLFTADLLPTLEAPVVGENVPRLHSNWIGRPFPEGLEAGGVGLAPEDPRLRNPLDRQTQRERRNRSPSRRRPRPRD